MNPSGEQPSFRLSLVPEGSQLRARVGGAPLWAALNLLSPWNVTIPPCMGNWGASLGAALLHTLSSPRSYHW